MRLLRIGGLAVAALFGLATVILTITALRFDPNDYKADVERAFERVTGRSLHLEGDLAITVYPWLGLRTKKASIANRAGFGDQPFAQLEELRVGVRLLPLLLQREVRIGRVRVTGLQVRLQVARDGTDNWSDVLDRLARDAAMATDEQRDREPVRFSIASLQFNDSRLTFDDRQADARYDVDHLDFETGRLERGRPVDARGTMHLTRNDQPVGRFAMAAKIDLTTAGSTQLHAVRGQVELAGLGRDDAVLPVEVLASRVALDTATRGVEVDALEARIEGGVLQATLHVQQGTHGPTVRGPVRIVGANPRRLLETFGATAPDTRDAQALTRLAASTLLTYSPAEGLHLESLDADLDGARVQGDVHVTNLARRSLRFDLTCDELDLDRYLGAASQPPDLGAAVATAAPADDRSPWPIAERLRELDLEGRLAVRRLKVIDIAVEDLEAHVAAQNGLLSADPMTARVFGGSTATRFDADLRGATPVVRVDQTFSDVDVAALLYRLIRVKQLEGRGRAILSLTLTGQRLADVWGTAAGTFDLAVEDGALIGADLWHEIEKAVAGSQKRQGPEGSGTGRTPFRKLLGRGTLENRTLRNERLEFVSDFAEVRGSGDVMFGANALDLDLTARLLKTPPGRVLGVKVSRIEGVDIPLAVTGRIDAPKVKPDVSALLGAVARSVVTEPFGGTIRNKLKKGPSR